MGKRSNQETRRAFLAGTGAAAGVTAFAAVAGAAEDVKSAGINAMMPTPEQLQAFTSLDHDGPVVMVNLLKFKPDGGAASSSTIRPLVMHLRRRTVVERLMQAVFAVEAEVVAQRRFDHPTNHSANGTKTRQKSSLHSAASGG